LPFLGYIFKEPTKSGEKSPNLVTLSKMNKLDAKTHPEIGRVNSPLKRVFSQRFGFQLVIKKLEADAV
jgi:hypothetical protein